MILPVSSNSGSSGYVWSNNSVRNIDQTDSFNLNNYNPVKTRNNPNANREVRGFSVQIHNIPEVMQWLAKKIEKDFKVKIYNSDTPFDEEELKIIYYTLGQIPPEDLAGVNTIVKNRGLQLNLQSAPSGVFTKYHNNKVYGAYDKDNKRIFLFELDKPSQVENVIKHEVGHAVHSYNMKFEEFYVFMLRSGWDVAYHEQKFIPGNQYYNIGLSKVMLTKEEALEQVKFFDWDSIKNKQDRYGKYVLVAPEDKKDLYAYKNPFETFAVFYEKSI